MRLIKASSLNQPSGLVFKVFSPDELPPYAILSHTWGDDEVIWADFTNAIATGKSSFNKVAYSCTQATKDGLEWVWIDSCCIDKSSSAELSEAINSMYAWYKNAEICYAHLCGVSATVDVSQTSGLFAGCRWFTRGWTLQELLAPTDLVFFSEDWVRIGEKATLSRTLSVITGIDEDILTGARALESASVAKRMSWAAHRRTTRPEDSAYCLMGLFNVNMPMLYGEGQKAFLRLQEEIMKESDDQSLFAWVDLDASVDAHFGLLAKSPRNFANSNSILPYQDWEPRPPYIQTNRGLRLFLPMTSRAEDSETLYIAALDCPAPPDYEDSSFLAIYLKRISHDDQQYARVRVGQFAKVHERGTRQTIYVRQNFNGISDSHGVFPQHFLQLRRGPDPSEYTVNRIIVEKAQEVDHPRVITSGRADVRQWVPLPNPVAFRNPKGPGKLAGALLLTRKADEERLLIMLGSAERLKVGFLAIELPAGTLGAPEEEEANLSFENLQLLFQPKPEGRVMQLDFHRVYLEVDTVVSEGMKFLMIDVHVEKTATSNRAEEAVEMAMRAYDVAFGRGNKTEAARMADQRGLKAKSSAAWGRLIHSKSK